MNIKTALFLLPLGLPSLAFATVGGPQNIEILGYEVKEQKLYVMRHYLDGRGRLPQLYYYNFKSAKPNQLIQVNSLYINPKTKRIDYDQDSRKFDQDIAKIKKRLVPLSPIQSSKPQLKILKTTTGTAAAGTIHKKKCQNGLINIKSNLAHKKVRPIKRSVISKV